MMHSGNVLAFVGDAVLSLQVRKYLVEEKAITKTKRLQKLSTKFVSANAQADFMAELLERDILNEEEMMIYKRGRNAQSKSSAKNADIIAYRMATGLEAVWGYLYLNDKTERLEELWLLYQEKVKEDA